MHVAALTGDEFSACAEGIKAKLFRILGESEPLTSTEIWAKAEVGLLLDHLASLLWPEPSLQAQIGAVHDYLHSAIDLLRALPSFLGLKRRRAQRVGLKC